MAKVGIVMGSDSDMPIMAKAADVLKELGIDFDMTIISAHREPEEFFAYAKGAEEKGYKVIIAGAGKAAHLPGMCAAIFPMPVIGIPMKTSDLGGVDSLYSIVQMPTGIPVATVAINGAANAGILAAKMLATVSYTHLDIFYMDYRELFKESNKEVEERFLLTRERIEEIAAGENNGMNEKIQNYFKKTAQLLKKCAEDFVSVSYTHLVRLY